LHKNKQHITSNNSPSISKKNTLQTINKQKTNPRKNKAHTTDKHHVAPAEETDEEEEEEEEDNEYLSNALAQQPTEPQPTEPQPGKTMVLGISKPIPSQNPHVQNIPATTWSPTVMKSIVPVSCVARGKAGKKSSSKVTTDSKIATISKKLVAVQKTLLDMHSGRKPITKQLMLEILNNHVMQQNKMFETLIESSIAEAVDDIKRDVTKQLLEHDDRIYIEYEKHHLENEEVYE